MNKKIIQTLLVCFLIVSVFGDDTNCTGTDASKGNHPATTPADKNDKVYSVHCMGKTGAGGKKCVFSTVKPSAWCVADTCKALTASEANCIGQAATTYWCQWKSSACEPATCAQSCHQCVATANETAEVACKAVAINSVKTCAWLATDITVDTKHPCKIITPLTETSCEAAEMEEQRTDKKDAAPWATLKAATKTKCDAQAKCKLIAGVATANSMCRAKVCDDLKDGMDCATCTKTTCVGKKNKKSGTATCKLNGDACAEPICDVTSDLHDCAICANGACADKIYKKGKTTKCVKVSTTGCENPPICDATDDVHKCASCTTKDKCVAQATSKTVTDKCMWNGTKCEDYKKPAAAAKKSSAYVTKFGLMAVIMIALFLADI